MRARSRLKEKLTLECSASLVGCCPP
jgi:hypothetical protein